MYTVETVCVPVPTDKCRKCNTVCQGDYWHLDYTQFLCSSCWNAEKYLELLSKDDLQKMKKIRNCAFMHNHEGTNAAEIILSPEATRKKIYLENYLDLYMKC
ncbi:uncharacterized protein LOC115887934 [Sitophilus oryzae]|uniref:Uncharacterized protein LOC115887934 n=1 Tax=Sitophilus oryzae TaxID=7048 RepID=A0A6J2YKI0_SITOR|nr:uncharacterized protein LOC115887934 [Sitophilus oryzae]